MSIMVYSRLGDLLRVRNLTVRDLRHRIAARFGPALDTRTLERLARRACSATGLMRWLRPPRTC